MLSMTYLRGFATSVGSQIKTQISDNDKCIIDLYFL